ncbi:MAG: hypothetical protein M1826_002417 [Phylliscum demangeonii]|nr:MAG: hypothetical protein M1826_002417 [Phylliscum demangeonii]
MPADDEDVKPYRLHVSSRYLDLTQKKLALTRMPHGPDMIEDPTWLEGIPRGVLEPTVDYWLEHYNWRDREAHFNTVLPQFRAVISPSSPNSALRLHFVHKRCATPNAIPLLYCHSWPGGFLEVIKIIDDLVAPSEGDLAFDVVVPSMPGCGFSDASPVATMGMKGVAEGFDQLMQKLGYGSYMAHGTGWGFDICRMLAIHHPSRCLAVHTVTPLPELRPPSLRRRPWQSLRYLIARYAPSPTLQRRMGYEAQDVAGWPGRRRRRPPPPPSILDAGPRSGGGLGTGLDAKPSTLAYALCDSPVGLLAWTRDALFQRTRQPEAASMQEAIDFTMLAWLPGPQMPLRYMAASAADPLEMRDARERWSPTPLGVSVFPAPATVGAGPPPAWAAAHWQPLVWTARHHDGPQAGWPVWQRPAEVARDLRAFAAVVVARDPRLRPGQGGGRERVA